ncbi:UNVERIFIED_CONTAM: hypothetical protein K2H54_077586 [Gekko kuhli]
MPPPPPPDSRRAAAAAAAPSVEEPRARWERKRRRVAQELAETEQQYLERLEPVATFFVAILKAKGTLKPAVLEAIFGPWESICLASRTLVFHLERGHMALGLEGFRHQLVLYNHYAENFAQAKETLQKQVRKNKSFARFKKLQETRPEFQGCRLEDLLPLPLRRLPQYKCLLEDLVENILPESSNFEQLRGRWYLQEGWLVVVPPKGGEEVQQRMFFLFSDILLVTKPCHPLHPWNSQKFACQAVYPLSQCTLTKVFGHTQSQGGLLSLSFPHKKLLLMSCDPQNFNKWHQNLGTAIRELQSKTTTVC